MIVGVVIAAILFSVGVVQGIGVVTALGFLLLWASVLFGLIKGRSPRQQSPRHS